MSKMTSSILATPKAARAGSGVPLILVGALCFYISGRCDSGFGHGFFLGACIALVLIGALLVGSTALRGPRVDNGHWLPSRDNPQDV